MQNLGHAPRENKSALASFSRSTLSAFRISSLPDFRNLHASYDSYLLQAFLLSVRPGHAMTWLRRNSRGNDCGDGSSTTESALFVESSVGLHRCASTSRYCRRKKVIVPKSIVPDSARLAARDRKSVV